MKNEPHKTKWHRCKDFLVVAKKNRKGVVIGVCSKCGEVLEEY